MLPLTMCKYFTSQNFYPTKFSPVKFSPLELTGEIGENLPLAKISRYTVVVPRSSLTSKTVSTGVGPSIQTHPLPTAATRVVPSTVVLCHTEDGTVTAIKVGSTLHSKAEPDPTTVVSRVPLLRCETGAWAQAALYVDIIDVTVNINDY